jgi:hypothetical protein
MEQENKPAEQPISKIDEAKNLVANIDEKIKVMQDLVQRNEEAVSRMILGGGTNGNIQTPQKSPEVIKKEGALEFWKGTGFEEAIKKYG